MSSRALGARPVATRVSPPSPPPHPQPVDLPVPGWWSLSHTHAHTCAHTRTHTSSELQWRVGARPPLGPMWASRCVWSSQTPTLLRWFVCC